MPPPPRSRSATTAHTSVGKYPRPAHGAVELEQQPLENELRWRDVTKNANMSIVSMPRERDRCVAGYLPLFQLLVVRITLVQPAVFINERRRGQPSPKNTTRLMFTEILLPTMARNYSSGLRSPRSLSVCRSRSRSPRWRSPRRSPNSYRHGSRSRSRFGRHESRETRDRRYSRSRSRSRLRTAAPKLTEELPPIPFVHQYRNGKYFYVRECYERYYKLVKEMLDSGERCVTVTGTPGVGTSVFYAYFFNHFRKEETDSWVIAMSHVMNNIAVATVFKGRRDAGEDLGLCFTSTKLAAIGTTLKEARVQKKKVLFLCDGAPTHLWWPHQMVVFTSPDEEWLRQVRKDDCTLFMPLWTHNELRQAAMALSFAGSREISCVSDAALETRFKIFGGVARECFLPSESSVERAKSDLQRDLAIFQSEKALETTQEERLNEDTKLASPFVIEEPAKHLLRFVDADREKIRASLDGIPQAAPLLEWIFEAGAAGASSNADRR
ncbi:hypothetical protein PHYSODRAFT_307350 [Phytophthora sojae]|uniref:Uncharacterized protein n=1 Tax=Phytophthora sojae (strain P6497) TaxID=1094619 RepID=G5AE12_PHYSP|nr:hypothetical protein PHYSODRAFT_307350 [Phytophthora sojae]EGZ06414.1 hypothetical protein PHYSODRAFT_307350 [Phytophthora sojae]|eukprot:XP_009538311.1 hypothetical protein PHYSODRAFT_307350 [Phytophthora sojae]